MKDGRPNQHGGTCTDCGQWVGPGDGLLRRKQLDDGRWGWVVVHGECPPVGDEAPRGSDVPRWAVYGSGRTPGGSYVERGVYFVDGAKPEPDAVPINDSARAADRM